MGQIIEIYLLLLLVHYIADFPLQGDFLGVQKSNYDYLLFVHCFIWTGCLVAALSYLGLFEWWKLAFLFVGHFVIDRWKARNPKKQEQGLTRLLWIDQALHALQCGIIML